MTFLEEFRIFVKNILDWLYLFVCTIFLFFLFGFKSVAIYGINFFLLVPTLNAWSLMFGSNISSLLVSDNSLTGQVFERLKFDLLPSDVQLIATNPMSAFISQIHLSILLAFLATLPFLIYKITVYLNPALLSREKKALVWSIFSLTVLFIAGSIFSYLYIIPETFKILYPFTTSAGAVPFFSITEFVQYILSLIMGTGLMFLLPVFMILFSFLGIIKPEFWIKKWRFGVMFFLILSAIIAPDVITMILLFIPLLVLYFLSYYFSKKFSRNEYSTQRSN